MRLGRSADRFAYINDRLKYSMDFNSFIPSFAYLFIVFNEF